MKKSTMIPMIVAMASLVVFGWGCNQSAEKQAVSAPDIITGPRMLDASGLSPEDLTKKINLPAGSVITMKHEIPEKAVRTAQDMGIGGKETNRTVVIKRFAPGQLAEVEWKLDYQEIDGTKKQRIGALVGSDLLASREMLLPAMWPEGEGNAFGTGLLWLSSDAYENLTQSGLSTFDFGLANRSAIDYAAAGSGLKAALEQVRRSTEKVSAKTEVSLSRAATSTAEWPLKVNGADTKVLAHTVKNWYGEAVFLANKQYPLVLKVKMNELPDNSKLNGLLDYEVTALNGLQD